MNNRWLLGIIKAGFMIREDDDFVLKIGALKITRCKDNPDSIYIHNSLTDEGMGLSNEDAQKHLLEFFNREL